MDSVYNVVSLTTASKQGASHYQMLEDALN